MRKIAIRVIVIFITILAVASVVIGIINYAFLEEQINEQLASYGVLGLFVISMLLEIIPQYVSPHIGIVSARLFNINALQITLSVLSGSILGSLFGFELGRLYGKEFVEDLIGKKRVRKVEKGINKWGKIIITIAAISPIPYVPLVIGALRMNRKKFVLWGVFPRILSLIATVAIVYWIF